MRALGMDPGSAASLRERIATDPMAMMGAARIGVRALPTLFGNQNNAQVAMQVLEGLQKVKAQGGDPLRTARMIGPEAEAMLPLLNMSERARKSLLGTADALAKIAEAKPASASADLDAAWERVGLAGDALKAALFNVFGTDMTTLVNGLADAMTGLATFISQNADLIGKIAGVAVPFIGAMQAIAALVEQVTGRKVVNPNIQAVNNNTAAVNNLTHLLKGQIYGGGARAAGALPSGLNGLQLNQMLQNTAHRMGHWTL
jgi:hypothetical protein